MSQRNNRPDILVHANAVIRVFDIGISSVGGSAMEKNPAYYITREAWIAAVYLLALSQITNKGWWLLINPEENSEKDSTAYSFVEVSLKRTDRQELPIQVFTRPETMTNVIFDSFKDKLEADLSNTSLVCYSNKSEKIDLIDLTQKIKQLSPKVRDCWIVGNRPGSPRIKVIIQVYPNVHKPVEVNLDTNYQKPEEKTFLQPYRGPRNGDLFEPLGKTILLKPNFDFEEL